jgi:D-methionine transport system ATP-binding protein
MIEIGSLTKRYGSTTVLDGIDFRVQSAEIAAVVGPSGAGKSTLARCINLLEQPTSGTIRVDGRELTRLSRGKLRVARRAIGTVFQSAGLLARLTAAENVALPLRWTRISPAERHERVRTLLERVGMVHRANHFPSQLSGGQQQRIGIARGLVLHPAVLLADEPTSGLDPESTASILRLLTELRDELSVAIVLITHEMDVVRSVADTVALLDHGRIVEAGRVVDVVRGSDSELSRALLPTPEPETDSDQHGIWQLRYERRDVDPTWLAAVSRELGADLALLSGLIESVGGETAGRAVVTAPNALSDDRITTAFADRGIHAHRVTAPAEELVELAA